MSGRTLLPWDRGLAGLFHEAAQAHLSGAQQFGVARLYECRQEHIEGTVHSRPSHDSFSQRVGLRSIRFCFVTSIIEQARKQLGAIKQPAGWNTKGCGQGLQCRGGRIGFFRFDLLENGGRNAR